MQKLTYWAALMALLLVSSAPAACQTPGSESDPAARKARILENLKFLFPQLDRVTIEIGDLEDSGVPGLEQGELVINGGQEVQQFLITADDKKFFLLAADPLDVSRTGQELADLRLEQEQAAAREAGERHDALSEIVAGLPVRGNPEAPVTIVEFSDFQCPYCARGAQTVEQILEKYPEEVKFVFLHFPLPNHPWAKPASIAAACAAEQSHEAFWTLHDGYFENQDEITEANVLEKSRAFLAGSSIDVGTWSTCADDTGSAAYQAAAAAVEQAMETGRQFGVSGTPGFFVNGHFVNGAQPLEAFEALIAQVRQEAR